MKITFFGAAQNVTGAKHLVESGETRLLFDCGLHQGKRHEADALNRKLPFDAASISATILSHAHTDHCGMLPLLVKNGYRNKIFATSATIDIAHLILLDSAKLQQQDYEYIKRRLAPGEAAIPPLYTADDVENARPHFEALQYAHAADLWHQLNQNCRFKFYEAGHILGSAVTVAQFTEQGATKTVAYTGDLGNVSMPLLHAPEVIAEPVDTLIIECTYGDRNHQPMGDVASRLKEIITNAVKNKQKIIVPAFALGRTQELIYILHKMYDQGEIPMIPVYLDSPLANEITNAFMKNHEEFSQETWTDFTSRNESPFIAKNLHYVGTVEESGRVAKMRGPLIVIASSGMAEGGRILTHLEHNIGDPNAIVLITGYQAENTLGRKLLEGVSPVRIYSRMHDVRARVICLDELSAHADQNGLLLYISKLNGLKKVFLVHCELPQATAFKKVLANRFPELSVSIPALGESFEL